MQVEPLAITAIIIAEKIQRLISLSKSAFHAVYKVYEYNTMEKEG
jgi:hypothetical protein